VVLGLILAVSGGLVAALSVSPPADLENQVLWKAMVVGAIVAVAYGLYLLTARLIAHSDATKQRTYNALNIIRFILTVGVAAAVFALVTEQWLGVLFSLGVVGFAITFALQQPLFSLIGWLYIMIKRPYSVGDRVRIEGAKGDVIDVDYLVTTLWEINGDLVSSNQPSGRLVTLPNSTVLSTQVYNYSWSEFPYVWNEISIQVAYETDLEFARQQLIEVADDYLGDEMAKNIERYRTVLAETPVELEVQDRPTVNVVQEQSWVELRLRYLVNPRGGQRVKNELYTRVLDRFNEHPERIAFPVSRNR